MAGRPSPSSRHLPAFTNASTAAERLAACQAYLKTEGERIQAKHQAGEPGQKIVAAIATKIDRLLQPLFAYALESWRRQHGEPPPPPA